jgi:diguanylate cyclase (GGDEF)-like protein
MAAKFLVAHTDMLTVHTLEAALRDEHHNLRVAYEGLDTIDRALDEKPDAIVMGYRLPGLPALDVARALRALEPTKRIPILILADTAHEASQVTHAGLPFVNCMVGPVELPRLREQTEKLLRARLSTPEPRAGDPDLQLAAISDPVTGLYARHYLLHRLSYEAARAARYHDSLSCILFGVEHLKPLSEALGRARGDRLLVQVANVFRRSARVADVIGRTGEDEFLVIAPHTDEKGAQRSAMRLHQTICEHDYDLPPKYARIGISVGYATSVGTSLADNLALLGRAEAALIQAKEGEEKVVVG